MKKNLLFIMSGEHNPRMIGCAGHPIVKTPHLDALAARGTRFTSAYTNSPICAAARAALATGQYIHRTRYWDNSIVYDGRAESWGHHLQRAGIRVESIGKLHFRQQSDPTGFDRQHLPMHIEDGVGMVQGLIRGQFPDHRTPSPRPGRIVPDAGPGETLYIKYDRCIADTACDWLAKATDNEPWALFVSFVSPHYPLIVPQEYFDLYPVDQMPLAKLDPSDGFVPHPWYERMVRAHSGPNVTEVMKRKAQAAYFGLCTFVDVQIGRVLTALEANGLTDRTQIIYTSDHGETAGSRGLWGKSVGYEEAVGVPLILAGPGVGVGQRVATPVSLVDAFPTVLAVFDLQPQTTGMPGCSWYKIASRPDDFERVIFSEYHAMPSQSALYVIRCGRYKLHYYVGYAPELFDLADDPEEVRNLAHLPEYREILAACEVSLRTILDPEATDREAKYDQKAFIERFGGLDKVLEKAREVKHFTEIPPEIAAAL